MKSRKLDINIFSQGLNRGFGPKMAIFLAFCFRQYWSGKCLLRYSRTKNAFLGFKKKKFEKSKTWHLYFSKEFNPWFWSKNGHFSDFFLGNIGQENVCYDILERKSAFLRYKNKKLKNFQNRHFSKGVNSWFWSKNGHFWFFSF